MSDQLVKTKRPHFCNVVDSGPAARHIWQFVVDKNELKPGREVTVPVGKEIDPKLAQIVRKDWHDLFKPKLNIAWIPADQVFLRAVQLPLVDRAELVSMLEFQLERLSPMPVAQVMWSAEVLPSGLEKMQTAVVCIVDRDAVDEFLGSLDEQGFQPDRLEIPQLNQILADGVRTDGAWIYPGSAAELDVCTVAWWFGGTLQHIETIRLPAPAAGATATELTAARSKFLQEQLMQTAWAGELEGWLALPIQWHLVGAEDAVAAWQPLLGDWIEGDLAISSGLSREGLARFTAARAAKLEAAANLLPVEFETKYRQQYIDRLWMRGLGAVVGLYTIGVAIYLVALQIYGYSQARVEAQVAGIANTYTNVLQLKERVEVLQEQLNLKYAALDCWKVTSEALPAEFNLTWLVFSRGRTLDLHGTAPPGQEQKVSDFNETIRGATIEGQQLFRDVDPPNILNRPGSPNINWNFQSQLDVTEGLP